MKHRRLLINASRVSGSGGLHTFTASLASCFGDTKDIYILSPQGVDLGSNLNEVRVPEWVGSSSRVSRLRPLLWFLYSVLARNGREYQFVLSTTHHALPDAKHQVITIHDIRPYFYPDSWIQHVNFKFLLPRAIRRCDGVLTVSQSSRSLIASTYRIPMDNIYVVPNVIDSLYYSPAYAQTMTDPFLLCIGSTWKHKNTIELLDMAKYWANRFRLKIVAGEGGYLNTLKKRVDDLDLTRRVTFLTQVTKAEIRDLYRGCAALIYPSLMEGFGLPPLEAMACGRPVIVSDIPVFRELYGDIPIYVRLGEPDTWSEAFAALESFSDRQVQAGIELAKSFSQERMRDAFFTALHQIWKFNPQGNEQWK